MHVSHKSLVDRLAETLSIPELEMDDQHRVLLQVGERTVSLEFEHAPLVILLTPLGKVPSADPESALRTVLVGQLGWACTDGATIGLDPSDNQLVMTRRLVTTELNGPTLLEHIGDFCEVADRWSKWLVSENAGKLTSSDGETADSLANALRV